MSHFDEITCMLYLDGQLDPERRAEFQAHVRSCAECSLLFAALERETQLLREAVLEEEPMPAHLFERRVREPVPWVWAAGWGLAAAGLYTLWTGIVEPMRQQLSQAGFGEGNLITMLFFSGAFWQGWNTMKTLIEFTATTTLGIVLLLLFGRRLRRVALPIIVAALLAAFLLPSAAQAAEVRKGDPDYSLPAGEVVKNDLILTATQALIHGEVQGDLIVFAESLDVDGHVDGDIIAFSRDVRVTGRVDGNIRDFSHALFLGGSVAKNLTAMAGAVNLDSKAEVNGGVLVGTGELLANGRIGRDLMAFADKETLNGFLGGDLRTYAGRLRIGSSAVIQGHAKYRGENQPEVSSQAKLASPLEVTIEEHRPDYVSARFYLHQMMLWGAIFLYGLALVLLMPRFFTEVVAASERYGATLGLGGVALIVTPILAIIACFTLVGLGVGIATIFLYAMAVYGAQTFVGAWIGQKLLSETTALSGLIGRMAFGLLVIRVIKNVPYIGIWLSALLTCWGMGALVVAAYRRSKQRAVPVPAPAPAA